MNKIIVLKGNSLLINYFSKPWLLLVIVISVTFFSYVGSLNNEFIKWDDDKQITDNSYVKTISKQNIIHNLYIERFTFIPLTIYSVLYYYFGLDPYYYHLLSLIVHLLNTLLAYALARKLLDNLHVAIFVAAIFALHPMRVESVAWISELKDLLFTFFTFLSFLFYIKYLKKDLKIIYFIPVILFAIFASFSKIQGLLIAPTLILFDIYFKRKFTFYSIAEKGFIFLGAYYFLKILLWYFLTLVPITIFIVLKLKPFINSLNKRKFYILLGISGMLFLLFIIYYLLNYSQLWSDNLSNKYFFSYTERIFLAGYSLSFYLSSFIYPFDLNAVHPYPQRLSDGSLPDIYYYSSGILLLVALVSVFILVRRKKLPDSLFFGWFFFIINISMVLHFIPIEGRLVTADRYSYLAYFGIIVLLSDLAFKFLKKNEKWRNYLIVLFVILSIIFSMATYSRTFVWKDTRTLFEDVLKKNPHVPFAYLNLGGIYLNNRLPANALKYFNISIKQDSTDASAYFNRALGYFMSGNSDSAIHDFNKVIELSELNSDKALVYTNMGQVYQKTGRDSLAFIYYLKSIETDSSIASCYNNRGMYYFKFKNLKNAFSDFDKAIKLDPDYADAWNNRGWVLTAQGNLQEANENFDKSILINPNYAMAYNNRGYLKFKLNNLQGALSDYNKALSLDTTLIEGYLNRGWVYSSSGNFDMAVKDFSKVLKNIKNHQTALTNRAFAWFYLKEYDKAELDFEMSVKEYPENAANHQNLAWFRMQRNNFMVAKNEFNISISLDSTLVNSYLNLGWIYLQESNLKHAESNLLKTIKMDPNNSQTLFLLGEVKRKSGNLKEACNYYTIASNKGSKEAKQALSEFCK